VQLLASLPKAGTRHTALALPASLQQVNGRELDADQPSGGCTSVMARIGIVFERRRPSGSYGDDLVAP